MAIISSTNLQTILDKAARWAGTAIGDSSVVTSPNAGLLTANSAVLSAMLTAIQGLTDPQQVVDLLPTALALSTATPVLLNAQGSGWPNFLAALDAHCNRYGFTNLDGYLTSLNTSAPALRAHGDLAAYLKTLSPSNVFSPTNVVLATVAVTGATAATFTHVAALNTAQYASGQIKVLNTSSEGLSSTVLTFPNAVKTTGAASISATITATTNGALTAFGDTSLLFTDCPVTSATISGGHSGDSFSIVIVPDRSVSGA